MAIDENFCRPANLREALSFLAETPEGQSTWLMAGGTDLMVGVNSGTLTPERTLDIWDLGELRYVDLTPRSLVLGPLTTYTQMIEDQRIARGAPLLRRAALEVGAVQIQNRGTLGGNIANASPAGDTLPVLAVHNARLELRSLNTSRTIMFNRFYTGYKQTVLRPDELIYRIHIPIQRAQQTHFWRKMGTRRAQSISKVVVAGLAEIRGGMIEDFRLAFGSVAPTVIRASRSEGALRGRRLDSSALEILGENLDLDVHPIDDIRSTARFRRKVCHNLAQRFMKNLIEQHGRRPAINI